ncbi:MAG: hypothetical protein JNL74_21845 [Fibrobacteres bacterium]|nr:hypothetical protein [Fibrobacterota bacterium]
MLKIILLSLVLSSFAYERPEGYYKHLFMDGGADLTSRQYFPGSNALADSLKYNFEFVATTSEERTVRIIAGNPESSINPAYAPDDNGCMLYPDGSPRYMMVYVNGGNSTEHGLLLTEKGRQNFRDFVKNGGSYIGTCAGAFIASLYSSTRPEHKPYPFFGYLHIWPGYMTPTSIGTAPTSVYPGMNIEDLDTNQAGVQNPLLQYHNFGGDANVDWVRHHGGPYIPTNQTWPVGTEILGRYDTIGSVDNNRVSLIAYKKDSLTGRAILNGCHPEGDSSGLDPEATGERYQLFSAKIQYAAAGLGLPRIKADLLNNVPRTMADNRLKGYEKIGDCQYHHYRITVPSGSPFLKVEVESESGFPLNVYAKKGAFAFNSVVDAGNKDKVRIVNKTLTVATPEAGEWFVAVELDTTVNAVQSTSYAAYSGAVKVLNGISYKIKASFNNTLPVEYNISATAGIHGTITPSGDVKVYQGGAQPFLIIPDTGYEVDFLTVDGVSSNAVQLYMFTDIAAAHTIDVKFKQRIFVDTVIVDNGKAGTSFTGQWANSTAMNNYGTQAVYNGKTMLPVGSYTWSAPIKPGASYSVEMWWTNASSRLGKIPVIISDGNTPVDTVYVDQKVNGGVWNMLMLSEKFLSDSIKVKILHNGSADSTICADAVRIMGNQHTLGGGSTGVAGNVVIGSEKIAMAIGPNPFNPMANIAYYINNQAEVSLAVYDMRGKLVAEPVSAKLLKSGRYNASWNGRDARGSNVASGLYLFVLKAGSEVVKMKAALLK